MKYRQRNLKRRSEALTGYLFAMPSFLGFILFVFIPICFALVLSFMKYDMMSPAEFVGLDNYKEVFTDRKTAIVYRNTMIFTFFTMLANVFLGLLLAVVLNKTFSRAITLFFRSVFFFPVLVGVIYISIVWQFFYQSDVGIINYYLRQLGMEGIPWLTRQPWALIAIIILDVWKNVGMSMLLFLAGLQNINPSYYEAATIDGANGFQKFFRITLPLIAPTLFFVCIWYLTGCLKVYDSIKVLTGGGPGDATRSVAMYIYDKGFRMYEYGAASAHAMILMLVIAVITALFFVSSKKWVHYE